MFGHVLGPLVRASNAAARPKPAAVDRYGRKSSKVEPEAAWPPAVPPASTELGRLLHEVRVPGGARSVRTLDFIFF
jgi:hypothetical protein